MQEPSVSLSESTLDEPVAPAPVAISATEVATEMATDISPDLKHRKTERSTAPAKKSAPQRREVHPTLQKLFTLHPALFGARFVPLKLGIFQDILALHPEAFEKDELRAALGLHTRSLRYLECVAAGIARHDLQGQPVEPVATGHVHHAMVEVFRRHQSRTLEDLRPELIRRMANAIEASGLNRDAYTQAVQTSDEALMALLDGAFAELDARTARREALLRAYNSSGLKSPAEFADMYGTDVAALEEALQFNTLAAASTGAEGTNSAA